MKIYILSLILIFVVGISNAQTFQAESFNAKADGITDNTKSIQSAIDSCHSIGGGTVELKQGVYLSGTLHLKSNVTLYINEKSVLKAITKAEAFEYIQSSIQSRMDVVPWRAFLHADTQENIKIHGGGTIDGSGYAPCFAGEGDSPNRPYGLHFINCKNIVVENLNLRSSAFWMQRYFACSNVRLNKLNIYNHSNMNNDGIDIDSSQDVIISDCFVDTSDDAICIKSEADIVARNIVVSNCVIATHASAIKVGTGSIGGFENISFNNIVIKRSASKKMLHPLGQWEGLTGIDLINTDGGFLRNVIVSNITMEDVLNPIHIRLGNRLSRNIRNQGTGPENSNKNTIDSLKNSKVIIPVLEDVLLYNIIATNVGPYPVIIAGYPGNPVRRVHLKDITIKAGVAITHKTQIKPVSWHAAGYPGYGMYNSVMPAYGLISNFTEDLIVENFKAIPATNEMRKKILHLNIKQ